MGAGAEGLEREAAAPVSAAGAVPAGEAAVVPVVEELAAEAPAAEMLAAEVAEVVARVRHPSPAAVAAAGLVRIALRSKRRPAHAR